MSRYRTILLGFLVASCFYLSAVLFDIDYFEGAISALQTLEHLELDEFIIPLLILALFVVVDNRNNRRLHRIEAEKVKVYTAMLSSTQHVVNNFLNKMQLFRISAEETEGFPPDVLELYDEIIDEAMQQIKALSSIAEIDEASILDSVAPKSNNSPGTPLASLI